jgi:hypothetical protein
MHYAKATQACDTDVELQHVNSKTKELVIHTKLKKEEDLLYDFTTDGYRVLISGSSGKFTWSEVQLE